MNYSSRSKKGLSFKLTKQQIDEKKIKHIRIFEIAVEDEEEEQEVRKLFFL